MLGRATKHPLVRDWLEEIQIEKLYEIGDISRGPASMRFSTASRHRNSLEQVGGSFGRTMGVMSQLRDVHSARPHRLRKPQSVEKVAEKIRSCKFTNAADKDTAADRDLNRGLWLPVRPFQP